MSLFQPDRCLILVLTSEDESLLNLLPRSLNILEKMATQAHSCCDASKHRATHGDI